MNHKVEQDKFEGQYFSKLSKAHFYDDKFKDEYDLITKMLPPNTEDTVLDMGCGKGTLGLYIANRFGCKVVFSDVSSVSKEYLENQQFVQCSMVSTLFAPNTFDKIYSLSVISHVEDIDLAIKEMRRIGKGEILLTTNNKYGVWLYKMAHLFGLVPKLEYDKTALNLYSKSTLLDLMKRNGWKIKSFCYYGKYATPKLPFNFLKTRLLIVGSR